MKKTTFVNSHPVGKMKAVKLFGFTVMCLVAFLFAGMQSAQAQKIGDVSEDVANQTIEIIQTEMDALEVEAKDLPADDQQVNFNLIDYYRNAIMAWRKGDDLKDALIDGSSSIQGGNGSARKLTPYASGGDSVLDDQSEIKQLQGLVGAIDLNDGGTSLQAVIDYLRTLKNQ